MAEEIIISVSDLETRVAVVEQGLLQEVFIERFHTRSTVGNIYKAKVARILPGMQSAFVDIGQSRTAFMHITDLVDSHELVMQDRGEEPEHPPITDIIHDGQEFLVQVTKEPISTKGARVSASISLASRFLVYMQKRLISEYPSGLKTSMKETGSKRCLNKYMIRREAMALLFERLRSGQMKVKYFRMPNSFGRDGKPSKMSRAPQRRP